MLFNSLQFMCFFPAVVAVYFVVPHRFRYIWLLAASYYFYMGWNAKYLLLILVSTAVTYLAGLLLQREQDGKNRVRVRKAVVASSLVINLGILAVFKYFNFFLENLNRVLHHLGAVALDKPFDLLLPVGISFYTFQALSYTIDVYRGEIRAERNPLRYALFVSFFPQLVAGPIERSRNLLVQLQKIHEKNLWDLKRIWQGVLFMLWGYFLKMVIADRASIFVDEVFGHYVIYGCMELLLAGWLFTVQLYCDFCSYSTIALGAARVMGISLMENFNTPYLACGIKDFWRRWHISLSSWMRDYVYIPLGGNRCSVGRKYVNLMVTFLVSGLWHGANWTFIVWGGIHGMLLVLESATADFRRKWLQRLEVNTECFSHRLLEIGITFLCVNFAWTIFRSATLTDAARYFFRMATHFDPWVLFSGELFMIGLNRAEMMILFLSIGLLFLMDLLRWHFGWTVVDFLERQNLWFVCLCVVGIFMSILVFGEYGAAFDAKQFIYFQF